MLFMNLSVHAAKTLISAPSRLTCNLRSGGCVVTDDDVRLGWQLAEEQSAYELEVRDAFDGKMVYKSGKVNRKESQLVPVKVADGYYNWRVRTYNNAGKRSEWSMTAEFIKQSSSTAFGSAQWVGAITKAAAGTPDGRTFTGAELKARKAEWDAADPLSRRSIHVSKTFRLNPSKIIRHATLNVCGLGFYELTVNGCKIGDSEFAPTWSDYDKSVFYNTFILRDNDLRSGVPDGETTLSVLLGNGFYNEQGGRYHKLRISFGPPTLKLRLHVVYADGTSEDVVTDASWRWSPSEITFNSIYGGEDYDARIEREWHPVVLQEGPKGQLRPQMAPPVKVMKTYEPQSVHYLTDAEREAAKPIAKRDITPGAFVLDMGQNLSGVPEIRVRGKRGQTVTLFVAETLTPEGACNQRQTGRQHYYSYTLSGNGDVEVYRPRFAYYGFRYVQVEGAVRPGDANPEGLPVVEEVRSCFVHNSASTVSEFECSNTLVNNTHELIDKATRSNMQSVFTDCPHREKLGWLEQDWLNGPGLFMNYDLTGFAAQTMQVIADAQHPNGAIPTTAPEYVEFNGPGMDVFAESPEWGGTFIMLPWMYYQQYGDDSLLRRYYDQMLDYVNYLSSQDSCGILSQGLGDWYDYGPFRAGFSHNTSVPLVSTAHHYRWTDQMRQIAALLGKSDDEVLLEARCERIKKAWQKEFLHQMNSQTAYAIALCLHLVPEKDRVATMERLKADIMEHGCRLTTGDIGNRYLYEVLCEEGEQELLYRMLNHYEVPGYGYQMRKGMTTLSEQWDPEMGSSMNHFMMGQIDGFHFTSLCGINISGSTVTFRPQPVDDISFAKGSTMTPYGRVAIEWKRMPEGLRIDIMVPAGMTAKYVHPDGRIESVTCGTHTIISPLANAGKASAR